MTSLLSKLFPPKIVRYDQLMVISPDNMFLQSMADTLGEQANVQLAMNTRIVLNGATIHLGDDETALALFQRRWWTSKPAVTVALLRNGR